MATISDELLELLAHIPENDQRRVLSYARLIAHPEPFAPTPLPPGTPGSLLAQLRVSPEVAAAMEEAMKDTEVIPDDDDDLGWPDS